MGDIFDTGVCHMAFFRDPDGNALMLHHRYARAAMIEVLGDAPTGASRCSASTTTVHMTWSRFGPGRAGADLHVHYQHTDVFHVLEGELTVMLADEEVVSGRAARPRPPHVVHGFRNGGDAEVRYLNLHVPGSGSRTTCAGCATASRCRSTSIRRRAHRSFVANVSQRRGSPPR